MWDFFLMRRPPPRSTLLPNTTLFRSLDGAKRELAEVAGPVVSAEGGVAAGRDVRVGRDVTIHQGRIPRAAVALAALDRKSTRLNSSHANISYAVFFLKQKTFLYGNST